MKWFSDLKIKAKMLVSFSAIIALLATLAIFATIQLGTVDSQNTYVSQYPVERETAVLEFQSSVRDFRRIVSAMTMFAPLNEASRITQLADEATAAFSTCLASINRYVSLTVNDPILTQAEKDSLIAKANYLRDVTVRYNTEIRVPVEKHSLKGEYEIAIEAVVIGTAVIEEMRDTTQHLLEAAIAEAKEASEAATDTTKTADLLIIIIATISALISVVIALYMAGMISKPLVLLAAFMRKAGSTGNLAITPADAEIIEKHALCKDELGQAISGSASFINHVTNIAEELHNVSNGDLTTNIEVLSESDTLGVSLEKMSNGLNSMFGEVQTSAHQVSGGSKQVSEGAQSLAQGSTEQASSIVELSHSIAEIAEKTRANAATADRTAKLSVAIKENAEMGSHQMDEMISAVEEINNASRNIGKIIKTIDDIAFQTNILALNAAVEAARAGQHGKGFAVVAEEVRDLASKSAEAAKDTGAMIQNSMEKARLGSRIAGETALSLKEIVNGINETNLLITEIAGASEEQSISISNLNSGIEKIALVVQQNNATAQESAAASQEMSAQSDILQRLIAQFKLLDDEQEYHHIHEASGFRVMDDDSGDGENNNRPLLLPKGSVRKVDGLRRSG